MRFRLGIDIGGTKIAYGLMDSDGVIVYRKRTPTVMQATPAELTQTLVQDINGILQGQEIAKEDIVGMALGFPSYVDQNGVVVSSGSMKKLKNYDAKKAMFEAFPDIYTIIENDTNIAAIAEHKYGAGRGYDDMMYTAVSTGIGSGFILNGKLYRGSYGGAGESGHMLITPDEGVECGCENRGCIMSHAAGSMIAEHAKNAIKDGRKSAILDFAGGDLNKISAVQIKQAFDEQDELAAELVDKIGYYMGIYIYNFFVSINLNCYVLGGGMILNFRDPLLNRIQATFDRYCKYAGQEIFIKYAELKEDVGIIGACELLNQVK